MTRGVLLTALITTGGLSVGATYQQAPPLPQVRAIQKVRDNLYFVSGGDTTDRSSWTGGNTAVFVTDQGVVLVDTMLAQAGRGILGQVKSITDKPVTTIINTHTHYDHTGSNTEFPATVEFVAHENTRGNMAKPACPPVTNCDAFKGANAKYLPKRTYKDTLTLFAAGIGSTCTTSAAATPTATPSSCFPRRAPCTPATCSRAARCPSSTWPTTAAARWNSSTLQKAVSTIKNVDTVIGGHTPSPVAWSDFTTYADFYRDFLTSAQAAAKTGVAVDAFVKAYRVPDKYKGFLADPQRVSANAQAIYKESGK